MAASPKVLDAGSRPLLQASGTNVSGTANVTSTGAAGTSGSSSATAGGINAAGMSPPILAASGVPDNVGIVTNTTNTTDAPVTTPGVPPVVVNRSLVNSTSGSAASVPVASAKSSDATDAALGATNSSAAGSRISYVVLPPASSGASGLLAGLHSIAFAWLASISVYAVLASC
jgi:hypothetical protein